MSQDEVQIINSYEYSIVHLIREPLVFIPACILLYSSDAQPVVQGPLGAEHLELFLIKHEM